MNRLQQLAAVGLVTASAALMTASLFNGRPAAAQTGQPAAAQPPASFEARLWDYLQKVQYRNWAPGPGQGLDAYASKSPHGPFYKMYVNRVAASDAKAPPHRSIVVKESYDKDKKTLKAVTVMYRVIINGKGFDPANFDWYWVKYNADGTVARAPADKGGKPLTGKVKSCITCHAGAKGGDYYFANDK